jgi:hypothetical protein
MSKASETEFLAENNQKIEKAIFSIKKQIALT